MSEQNEKFTNVYINNIDPSIDNSTLKDICEEHGGRVLSAIVIRERGVSLGYGFCNFVSHEEAVKAVERMNNLFVMGKRLAVSRAASKTDRAKFLRSVHSPSWKPEENANVYVKNLDYSIDEEVLRSHFRPFGPIINVRIMRDDIGNSKGYGFVSYAAHTDAVKAVDALDGVRIGKLPIHVDFYDPKHKKPAGRAPTSAPASPFETFTRHNSSSTTTTTTTTPAQCKVLSPLVIPSKIEESPFCCGTPLNQDEVCDIESASAESDCSFSCYRSDNSSEEEDDEDEDEESDLSDSDSDLEESVYAKYKHIISFVSAKDSAAGSSSPSSSSSTSTLVIPPPPTTITPSSVLATPPTATQKRKRLVIERRCNGGGTNFSAKPRISQLIEGPQTQIYKENEIKVHGLRYLSEEKNVLHLFYDYDNVRARPALNARGMNTGEWYVTFASKKDAERALAMCNGECLVVRGCRVRAERALLVERTAPQVPSVRFARTESPAAQRLASAHNGGTKQKREEGDEDNEVADLSIEAIFRYAVNCENRDYMPPSTAAATEDRLCAYANFY